jgi:hypothetical protein
MAGTRRQANPKKGQKVFIQGGRLISISGPPAYVEAGRTKGKVVVKLM